MSTDRRKSRDKIKISKLNYLNRQLNAIQDDNFEEQTIAFKKAGNKKTYVRAQRLVYSKSVRELDKKFMELSGIDCSHSLFYKYKPFYVIPPTEWEQQSCLCIRCQNSYLLLKGVNSYYLQKIRSRNISKFQFKLLLKSVYLEPDEVYQSFAEIDENLTTTKKFYMTIASQL